MNGAEEKRKNTDGILSAGVNAWAREKILDAKICPTFPTTNLCVTTGAPPWVRICY
jgi:hypothetical protein